MKFSLSFICLIGDNEEEDVDMKEDSGIKFMNLFLE